MKSTILEVIRKRWYIVVAAAILGALTLFVEKQYINPFYIKQGTFTWSKQIQLNPVPIETVGTTSKEILLDKLIPVTTSEVKLLNDLNSNIEMNRVNAQWDYLSNHEKYEWLRTHFSIQYLSPGIYELTFHMKDFEARDNQYLIDNGLDIMNIYNNYVYSIVKEYDNNVNLINVNDVKVEDFKTVTRTQITMKYVFIGMILGGAIGFILVILTGVRKQFSINK